MRSTALQYFWVRRKRGMIPHADRGDIEMKARILFLPAVVLAVATGTAWPGDNVQVTVSAITPAATQKLNGNNAIQGTIQLWYAVHSFTFPVGNFGSFLINMNDVHLNGTNNAAYPASLSIHQNGSE